MDTESDWPTCASGCESSTAATTAFVSSTTRRGTVAEIRVPVRRRGDAALLDVEPEKEADYSSFETQRPSLSRARRMPGGRRSSPAHGWSCAAVWIQQSYFYLLLRHRLDTASWSGVIRFDVSNAAIWMMLTPVILWIVPRLHSRVGSVWGRVTSHAILAVVVTVVHVGLLRRSRRSQPRSFRRRIGPTSWSISRCTWCWRPIASRVVLEAGFAPATRAASACTQFARAWKRVRGACRPSRGAPRAPSIGSRATWVATPRLTERQLARLGDYLRAALETTDDAGATPERRRRLDHATAELRASGVSLVAAG
jgi:hypothetical protein